MAEGGHDPNLDPEMVKTCEFIEKSVQSLELSIERQTKSPLASVIYLGRYIDGTNAPIKCAIHQKEQATKSIEVNLAKEAQCRKALDHVKLHPKGSSSTVVVAVTAAAAYGNAGDEAAQHAEAINKLSMELQGAKDALESSKRLEKSIFQSLADEVEYLKSVKKRELMVKQHSPCNR